MLKILRKTVLSLLKENIMMINCAFRSYCGVRRQDDVHVS